MALKINPDWFDEVNDVVRTMRVEIDVLMTRVEESLDRMENLMRVRATRRRAMRKRECLGGSLGTKGVKGNYLPRVVIQKFDRRDVRTWISKMEQYFSLHQISIDKRIILTSLHMETESFQWYQWMKKRWARLSYRWENFVEDLAAQYDNIWEDEYFNQLTKVKQMGSIMEYTP
eukprot:Gb_05481 [translate_table: standard]